MTSKDKVKAIVDWIAQFGGDPECLDFVKVGDNWRIEVSTCAGYVVLVTPETRV